MTYRKRGRRATLAAGLTTTLVAVLHAPAAHAVTNAPTLTRDAANERNASDPYVFPCYIEDRFSRDLCMYTSSDLNAGGQNYYPMDTTYLYTLDLGAGLNPGDPANWVDRGPVLHESDYPWVENNNIPWRDDLTGGTKHLWAPNAIHGPDGLTYLYVPDVENLAEDISHIGVSVAPSPTGSFTYQGQILYQGQEISDYYMSDPAVVVLGYSHPGDVSSDPTDNEYLTSRQYGPATWLLWANGHWEANAPCGGLSIGLLNDVDMMSLYTDPNPAVSRIQINGLAQALGRCNANSTDPYLEGPELYDLSTMNLPLPGGDRRFMLTFSAKPEGGTHGQSNQVIAYATASDPRGPYTYEGVLMEGSTTSWTNQGSLYGFGDATGLRFWLFYHDDSSTTGNHNRKVYATCLTYDLSDRKFVPATRPSSLPNLNNCAGTQP